MSWAKLDDRFPDNKKVASLSNSAFRLHVTALCYAAEQLTDGFLAVGVIKRIGWASDNIQQDITDLTYPGSNPYENTQLWEPTTGGYLIHDNELWGIQADADVQELRKTRQYKQWRTGVLRRDNHACVMCHSDSNLHAHHVLPWALYEAKRLEEANGITLCRDCHNTAHHKAEG